MTTSIKTCPKCGSNELSVIKTDKESEIDLLDINDYECKKCKHNGDFIDVDMDEIKLKNKENNEE